MKVIIYFICTLMLFSCNNQKQPTPALPIENNSSAEVIWENSTQKLLGAITNNDLNTLKTFFKFPIVDSITRGMHWSHIRAHKDNEEMPEVAYLSELEFEQHYNSVFFLPNYSLYYPQINIDSVIIAGQHSVRSNDKKEYLSVVHMKDTNQILLWYEDTATDPTLREEYVNGRILYFDILKNGNLLYNSVESID
jgi:hypothetical protein